MDRLVHHELRAAFSMLAVVGISIAATAAVHRSWSVEHDGFWLFCAGLAGCSALWTLLRATRLKGVGALRKFEAAVPLDSTGKEPPALRPLRHDQPFGRTIFFAALVPTLAASLLWEPWTALLPLLSALEWLGDAATAAHWERRNGLVLWRGHVASRPWELSVSPRPVPRTADDAPSGTLGAA